MDTVSGLTGEVPGTSTLRITGGRVSARPDAPPVEADIEVAGGRLVAVGSDELEACPGRVLDATGLVVAPGLIDLQVNGGYGHDLTDDPATMWALGERLAAHGVTAFLPTLVSPVAEAVIAARAALDDPPAGYAGAVPLGLHVEGPMLNPARAGAHRIDHLIEPSPAFVAGWSPATGVRMVTLAPELPGAEAVISALVAAGVVVALGHSEADTATCRAAFAAGARHVTHLFNAMAPWHHRAPGIVGWALDEPSVTVGLIVDGVHCHPEAVRLAWRVKESGQLALVTDAASAQGLTEGEGATLGGRAVSVDASGVRNRDGGLAGSDLTLDRAVRNLVEYTGCPVAEALAAASSTPARILGLASKMAVAAGADADLMLVSATGEPVVTVAGGNVVFDPEGRLG